MATNDSPIITSPLLTRGLQLGEQINIEFPGGGGVSARFAGVDIEPGGARFSIHCNPDGRSEELECTCPPNGIDALTLANADLIRERDHLREALSIRDAQLEHADQSHARAVRELRDAQIASEAFQRQGEQAQAAAENWESMYRNLAEMQPVSEGLQAFSELSDVYASADNAKMESEDVGGDEELPEGTSFFGGLKQAPQQLVINLYMGRGDQ